MSAEFDPQSYETLRSTDAAGTAALALALITAAPAHTSSGAAKSIDRLHPSGQRRHEPGQGTRFEPGQARLIDSRDRLDRAPLPSIDNPGPPSAGGAPAN